MEVNISNICSENLDNESYNKTSNKNEDILTINDTSEIEKDDSGFGDAHEDAQAELINKTLDHDDDKESIDAIECKEKNLGAQEDYNHKDEVINLAQETFSLSMLGNDDNEEESADNDNNNSHDSISLYNNEDEFAENENNDSHNSILLDDTDDECADNDKDNSHNSSSPNKGNSSHMDEDDDDIMIIEEPTDTEPINDPSECETKERQRTCDKCGVTFIFKELESLKIQILIYKGVDEDPCDECNDKCQKLNSLYKSIQNRMEEKIQTCLYCEFHCKESQELQKHMKIHEAEELTVSPQISSPRVSSPQHLSPQLYSPQADTLSSNLAEQLFDSQYFPQIESSLDTTYGSENWFNLKEILPITGLHACPHCDYKTNYTTSLRRHLLTHNDERPFACPYCDYRAKMSKTLKHHVSRHTGEKPYKCPYCDHRAIQKTSMMEHIRTHTGERPHVCPQCDYAAINGRLLKKHMQSKHNFPVECSSNLHQPSPEERQITCRHCEYTTINKDDLKTHLQMEHATQLIEQEKPHSCPYCSYRTKHAQYLQRHMMTHSEERPYACPYCDYRAKMTKTLQLHIQTHTGIRPYSCKHCDYTAIQKNNLKVHIRTKHNLDSQI